MGPRTMLKMMGVEFSEGSSSLYYSPSPYALIVRNTAESIAHIDSILDAARVAERGPLIAFAAHVVEAKAATIRQLADETRGVGEAL